VQAAAGSQADLTAAEELLVELNRRLDGEVTWEVKRQLVELLIEKVLVETIEQEAQREARVKVKYRFKKEPPADRDLLTNGTPLTGGDDGPKLPADSSISAVVNDRTGARAVYDSTLERTLTSAAGVWARDD
jgi:hypothetical protein